MRWRLPPHVVALALVLVTVATVALGADADEQFQEARSLAFAGRYIDARALCEEILADHPNYYDVRILLGRTYAWDSQYDAARREFLQVLESRPGYSDARSALCDVELWSHNPDAALRHADEGLAIDSENPDLLERRARALAHLGREEEAAEAAREVLRVEPGRQSSKKLYHRLIDVISLSKIAGDVALETFQEDLDNWYFADIEYRYRFNWGSILGRVNWARRFGQTGVQYEVDAYPRIGYKTYLYVNAGVSSSSLFPDYRYAAEAYHNFKHGWEASLGFRQLEFDTSDVTIVTGTVAKYLGNWWISFRPNYVIKDDNSTSAAVSVRRFFGNRREWAGFTIGGGLDRTDAALPGGPTDPSQRVTLAGFKLLGEIRKRISATVILKGAAGFRSDDLTADRTRRSFVFTFGAEYYF